MAEPAAIVRLLINDVDDANLTFEDDDIDEFLTLEGGDVKLAAAQALDTIASNEALVQKRIRTLNLSTDGAATAKELRAHATALRGQVADAAADADAGAFEFVGPVWSPERAEYPEGW